MRRYKLAFIGGGINSAVGNVHKIASQMDSRFILETGVFSRNEEKNQKTAEEWNVNRIYKDWKELLDNEKDKIDAVVVLTPIDFHKEIIIEALKMGYNVISEKPLCNSVYEAVKIKDVLNNNFMVVTYNYTGYVMIRELREIIKNNILGKILHIEANMPQEGYLILDGDDKPLVPQKWRLNDGIIPTVSLDLGIHLHNIINFLTDDKPKSVVGVEKSNGHFNVVDCVSAMIEYESGMSCNMQYGKSFLGNRNGLNIKIYGEYGSANWSQIDPEVLTIYDRYGNKREIDRGSNKLIVANKKRYNRFKIGHPSGFIEAFANYYYDIANSLEDYNKNMNYNNKYICNLDVAIEGFKLFEAISKSSKERVWVNL